MESAFSKKDTAALKGIAILFMMFHHNFRDPVLFEKFGTIFTPLPQSLAVNIFYMFKICVPIFVFITGYGLLLSMKSKGDDLKGKKVATWTVARLVKVLSGFWFIILLSWIVTQCLDGHVTDIYFKGNGLFGGLIYMVLDFFGVSSLFHTPILNGTWWYMSAAVVFVCLIPLFYKVIKKIGYIPAILALIMIPRVLGIVLNNGNTAGPYLMALVLGMMFADYDVFSRIRDWRVGKSANLILTRILEFVVLLVVMYAGYKCYYKLPTESFWELKWGIYPVVVICFSYLFLIGIPGVRQVLCFLGKHSMNIFMIHTFIRYNYLAKFIYSFKHFVLIVLALLIVSLIISMIIEGLKKLIHYEVFIGKIVTFIEKKAILW